MRHQTPQGELLNNFVSGSVGGFVGTLLNTPYVVGHSPLRVAALNSIASFDVGCLFFCLTRLWLTCIFQVVKSRIQGAENLPGVIPKYNWTYPA